MKSNTKLLRSSVRLFVKLLFCSISLIWTLPTHTVHAQWEFAGWFGGGMYPAIVQDTQDPQVLFLTSDVAGLWRSENGGETWQFKNNGLTNLNISFIAIAPSDNQRVYAASSRGLHVSEDRGDNWTLCHNDPTLTFKRPWNYRSIAIDPKSPNHLWVATANGKVYESTDACRSWKDLHFEFNEKKDQTLVAIAFDDKLQKLFVASSFNIRAYTYYNDEWSDLYFNPDRKQIYDLLMYQDEWFMAMEDRVLYSRDNGKSWQESSPIPKGKVARIALHPDLDSNTLVIAWHHKWSGGMLRSRNKGHTWETFPNLQLDLNTKLSPTRVWMKNLQRPNSLLWDTHNQNTLFYTDSWGVWKSTDAGKTWHEAIQGAPNTSGSDIEVGPLGQVAVATMDQGLLLSEDGGKTYQSLLPQKAQDSHISGHYWRILWLDEANLLVTSTSWHRASNTVYIVNTQSRSWHEAKGLQILATYNTLWGKSYARALAQDKLNTNVIYLGMDGDKGGGIFISEDRGESWTLMNPQPDARKIYNALATDPTDSSIYWGTCDKWDGIAKYSPSQSSWSSTFSPSKCIFNLQLDDSGTVYAGTANQGGVLYSSKDKGERWKELFADPQTDAIDGIWIHPQHPTHLYISTMQWNSKAPATIYKSPDSGRHWIPDNDGLPTHSGAADFSYDSQSQTLYVLLSAGGVYKKSLSETPSS